MCVGHLIHFHNLQPFSSRLRQLVIRSIELIGYQGFEQVAVGEFVRLLNDVCVGVEDMDSKDRWGRLLMDTIQSSEGIQYLSYPYWKLLVEFAVSEPQMLVDSTYNPSVITSLEDAKEWDKLECWMGVVWILWPPEDGETVVGDLEHTMQLLSCQWPGAIQKLEQWMEQWSNCSRFIPESFQQMCKQVDLKAVQQDTL